MKYSTGVLLSLTGIFYLSSCGNLGEEAEKRLEELMNKTESLDSLINTEVDKVLVLDSLITDEAAKVRELDSLIHKSASKLDSLSNEKKERIQRITR